MATKEPKQQKKQEKKELAETDLRPITLKHSQTKYLNLIVTNDITFCYGRPVRVRHLLRA